MTLSLSKSPQSGKRDELEIQLRRHEQVARDAAECGNLEDSARSILAMLDCERRMAAQGPQVLQVIKPRSASRGLAS